MVYDLMVLVNHLNYSGSLRADSSRADPDSTRPAVLKARFVSALLTALFTLMYSISSVNPTESEDHRLTNLICFGRLALTFHQRFADKYQNL